MMTLDEGRSVGGDRLNKMLFRALPHGFPYDIHAYDDVAPALAAEGVRVIVPFLRGFGPMRFLPPDAPRSGQQAALGADLLALLLRIVITLATLRK